MYKLHVINELNGREFGSEVFDTQAECQAIVDAQEAKEKCSYGEKERWIKTDELPAELSGRVLETRMVVVEEGDDFEESKVKADYVVTIQDVSADNEVIIAKRVVEYPRVQELMHVLCGHGLESQEWADLMAERAAVKAKYPKS